MTEEPTVLDYVKSLLTPWRGKPLEIPPAIPAAPLPGDAAPEANASLEAGAVSQPIQQEIPILEQTSPPAEALPAAPAQSLRLPWRALLALGLALIAQISLEPRPNRSWVWGAFFYLLAAGWLAWAYWRGEWRITSLTEGKQGQDDFVVRAGALLAGLPLVLLAYLTFADNRFTPLNTVLWLLACVLIGWALWSGELPFGRWAGSLKERLRPPWRLSLSPVALALIGLVVLVIFFRVYRLDDVPPEMVSDQAEKLLDVGDVLEGQYSIFFPRNTGREGFQMYLTAAIARVFDTGLSFMSLKIGTVLAGLVTLVFIYLLGKEAGNRRAGLFAAAFAGVAYWPNVISRIGLRFALYPLFVAPTLYFLLRGLRRRQRNDFILAGLFLGLGLHGYSPFRIVPLLIIIALGLYLIHRQSKGARWQALWWFAVLVIISALVFLPLLRFAMENPDLFSYRAMTRLGSVEQPLPGPAGLIFLKNLGRAMAMFFWENGQVWVVSIPNRPALDLASAGLFALGAILILIRYAHQRHWVDLFLLISIPILMLPSILSLAFPAENPILNRTAGAIVPVFVIIGIALDGLISGLEARVNGKTGQILAWGVAIFLLGWASMQNYHLVFNEYQRSYELSAWNTSDMGQVIQQFGDLFGTTETAWVVAYPHWVDTRLVGINAGEPKRDFAIWPDRLGETVADPRPKLFLVKPDDQMGLAALRQLYPQGNLQLYDSPLEGKDFMIYLVLPEKAQGDG